MLKNQFLFFLLSFLALALVGCKGSYQQVLKSTDYQYKMEKAKEYYAQEEYVKAIPLFEELMTIYKGTQDVEEIFFLYPYSHYGLGDYLVASFYFQNFVDSYPRSNKAEEAKYMIAYCYYKLSPVESLDQTYTEKSMESLQLFVNAYPDSDRVDDCNKLMDEMRRKLEKKAFVSAELYFNLENYKAAATAFNNVLDNFPDTPDREKLQFLIVKSYHLLAEHSIPEKQLERYNLAIDAYLNFVDNFAGSDYLKQAEKIYQNCQENIEKISQL